MKCEEGYPIRGLSFECRLSVSYLSDTCHICLSFLCPVCGLVCCDHVCAGFVCHLLCRLLNIFITNGLSGSMSFNIVSSGCPKKISSSSFRMCHNSRQPRTLRIPKYNTLGTSLNSRFFWKTFIYFPD